MRIADRQRAYRYAGEQAPAFISTWDTTKTSSGSSTSTQVKLPLTSTGVYNFTVDWGDGNSDVITAYNQSEVTHTYSSSGTYALEITGIINGWQFNNTGDRLKITNIASWSVLNVKDSRAFYGCSNLTVTATDGLGAVGLTTTSYMFSNCTSLATVPLFDLSSVTNASYMFSGCTNLTEVPLFNLSSVVNANSMFYNCTSLVEVPLFDLSSVTNASRMFSGCTSLAEVPLFDLSSVTNTNLMFSNCTSLATVPLFDLSSVTNAGTMFYNCTSITAVPLFDLSSVTDASNMFTNCTLTTTSYSNLLIHLDTLALKSSVSFHGGNSKYNTAGGTARTNIINDHSWTITDGGAE